MRYLLLLAVFVLPSLAMADLYFKPGVMYYQDKLNPGGPGSSEATTSRTFINVALLFAVKNEWVLGGMYDSESTKRESSSGSSEEKRTNLGLSGGWVTAKDFGGYALAHYYVSCSLASDSTKYAGSTCYQIDVGLKASVRSTGFGAQLSYRKFAYNKVEVSGTSTTLEPPREETNINPMFTVFLKF